MRYAMEKVNEIIVIRLQADMWGKIEDYQVKDEVAAQIEQGGRRFVFDLSGASAINSTGIGIVVSSMTAVQRAGGRIRICSMNPRVKATFQITGIAEILSIFDDLDSAIKVPWPEVSEESGEPEQPKAE